MTAQVFDGRTCSLGEGPLWHPLRNQLFWFDILDKRLLTLGTNGPISWQFDEYVSAAGWVDEDTLLMASASGLWRLDLATGDRKLVCPLEQNNTVTRSNDGRADPWGGFWIGTMGIQAEPAAGAIYRYYQGTLKRLFSDITISNAICFAPNRSYAYFTDTPTRQVMRVPLDRNGWPTTEPSVFIDLRSDRLNPDGAVVDAQGNLWIAQWGAGRIAGYDVQGRFLRALEMPAIQVTCPAFGGAEYAAMYVTTAADGVAPEVMEHAPMQGMTFKIDAGITGLPEPKVIL